MSSQVRDSDEICENNNCDVKLPPELAIKLPSRKDIGATRVDWTTAESALLPIDVLLVTVKDYEHVNCYYYLKDTTRSWCHGLGMVDFGTFGDGGVKVALIRCEKGSTEPRASLIVVNKAVETLKPKAVACVGFCGSLNRKKAKLGDVVISAKLATYSNMRTQSDGTEEMCGVKVNVSKNMGDLIPYASDAWDPPIKEASNYEVDVHRQYVMLSGPEVVNNPDRRQALLKHHPDAIAIEMEGEGLYAAAFDLGIEWVVVKGVSDFADGSKTATGDWQPFASAMAASVVHNMFKYSDVIERWPHYEKTAPTATSTAVTPVGRAPVGGPSLPIDQFLRSIADTTEGRRMHKGRTIHYTVSGRIHSVTEPWVYDATAKDVVTNHEVEKKHYKTADLAINGAIEELVKQLKERKLIQD